MILVSYTTSSYYENMEDMLHECAEKYGIEHRRYDRKWLESTSFYKENKTLCDDNKAGFFCWKPYLIYEALKQDDLVIYTDASVVFYDDPRSSINSVDQIGVGDCGTSWVNRDWTKRDCFVYMDCDKPRYWDGYSVWAGLVVARRTSSWVIEEWMEWSKDRRIISDDPNTCGLPNFPAFKDHRHDQSILTNMSLMYPITIQKLISPFQDYSGNWSEWVPWNLRGKRK